MTATHKIVGAALWFAIFFPLVATAQDSTVKIGSWDVKTTKDGFTDTTRGIAISPIVPAGTMVVKCDKQGPGSLYISFLAPKYLGGSSGGQRYTAPYRVDDGAPESVNALLYDGRTANLLDGNRTDFLNSLVARQPKRLRFRFTSYSSEIVDFDADVTSFSAAVRATAAICLDSKIAP